MTWVDSAVSISGGSAGTVQADIDRLTTHTSGWVNVKDFGAVGNGITNDTASIQAAYTSVPDGTVLRLLVPAGTYVINSTPTYGTRTVYIDKVGVIVSGGGTLPGNTLLGVTPYVNALDNGVTGDGTTDDTSALQACLTNNPGRTVFLPRTAGGYRITSAVTVAQQALVGEGAARGVFDAGDTPGTVVWKDDLDCSMFILGKNATLANMVLESRESATSGKTISVIHQHVAISGVTIQAPTFGDAHWDGIFVGSATTQVVAVTMDNVMVLDVKSSGITFDGSLGAFMNDFHLKGILIVGNRNGGVSPLGDGVVMRGRVEAIQLTNASILLCKRGLYLTAPSYVNNGIPDYTAWSNIIIDTCTDECVLIHRASFFNFTDLYVSNATGWNIKIQEAERISFQGGTCIQGNGGGILLDNSVTAGYPRLISIRGVGITNNQTVGVSVSANLTDFIIQGNTFSNTAFPNAGTLNQTSAVSVTTGTSDRYVIADNLVDGTTVADNGSGVNKRVANNY